ncbi:NADH dehydrogenase FAD-containing subunit [Aquibacillus albus]|uniref:NADH dehydrogenase FAD-containing subunit n=2 Tax=Aquibacillus albus TaxID=1168171 RepID=A0ABS2N624_9BACI|nr:NADH dehydrogenase FAD-containing subunit [Aquibacillus albus]
MVVIFLYLNLFTTLGTIMKRLLLVGGGHAHVHVVKKLKELPIDGVEVMLLSPSQYQYYSGMFPGYAEGLYDKSQISINLESLAKASGVSWVKAAVTAIDPLQKKVLTSDGEMVSFDVISFNIGSLTAGINVPGVTEHAYRMKPNYHFVEVIDEVRDADNVVVVGGDVAGIETSLSLASWRTANHIHTPVTLMSADRLLPNKSKRISAKIEAIVMQNGIHLVTSETVSHVKRNKVVTSSNKEIHFDKLVWLAGSKAPDLFKTSKLPVDDHGYLKVADTLQVKEYPFIFGVGDCASIADDPAVDREKGHAVRQGRLLFENLKGFMETGEGELYQPKKNELSIVSIGNKKGLLLYKGYSMTGRWAWYLKNWIDSKLVKQYKK